MLNSVACHALARMAYIAPDLVLPLMHERFEVRAETKTVIVVDGIASGLQHMTCIDGCCVRQCHMRIRLLRMCAMGDKACWGNVCIGTSRDEPQRSFSFLRLA